jgi:ubiquinone/menaquinone biosynthesis C-methylase UbiE
MVAEAEPYYLLAILCACIFGLVRAYSPEIYDYVILEMTKVWYKKVLEELPIKSMVLDIGIGTGSALCENKSDVIAKEITFIGLDYNETYVMAARANIQKTGLSKEVQILHGSVYDILNHPQLPQDIKFDAVYFSGSFSLMPSPPNALKVSAKLLKPRGKIYITQTFQKKAFFGMSIWKPWLKYLTTIDFGELVMESEVVGFVKAAGMRIERNEKIAKSVDNVYQSAILLIIDPEP